MPSKFLFGLTCLFACALLVGCSDNPQVADVTGVITLNGKPLEFVHVEFWPEVGPRSIGKTNAEGRFTLKTDDDLLIGAVPGSHKVSLKDTWHMKDDYINDGGEWVDMSKGRKSRIHTKYYDAAQSPLSVKVEPGKVNTFDFPVDVAPK